MTPTSSTAMVQAINTLPGITLPEDGGVRAGQPVQWADAVISTGDIANRMEGTDERLFPSATECWARFEKQYITGTPTSSTAMVQAISLLFNEMRSICCISMFFLRSCLC